MGIWANMMESYLYLGFDSSFSSLLKKVKIQKLQSFWSQIYCPFFLFFCAACEGFYYSGNAVEKKYFIITDFVSSNKAFAFLIFPIFMSSSVLFRFNLRLKLQEELDEYRSYQYILQMILLLCYIWVYVFCFWGTENSYVSFGSKCQFSQREYPIKSVLSYIEVWLQRN